MAGIVAAVVRPEICALAAYSVSPSEGMIKLDAMENPFPLPDAVQGRLGAALAQVAVNRYPDIAADRVKQALSRAFAIPDSLGLMLGNGSDELIQLITSALARPGAAMLAPDPSFVMYRLNAIHAGMRFVAVPLASDFGLDRDAMLAADRAGAPGTDLSRLSEQSDRQSVRRRRCRGDHPRLARPRRRRRSLCGVRRCELPVSYRRIPESAGPANAVESRHGRHSAGLRDRRARVDRAVEQAAAAV